jgi:hypothetical protein
LRTSYLAAEVLSARQATAHKSVDPRASGDTKDCNASIEHALNDENLPDWWVFCLCFKYSSVERVNLTFCGDLYLSLFDEVAGIGRGKRG